MAMALVAALLWMYQHQHSANWPGNQRSHEPSASANWQRFENCHLVNHPTNDGDSFVVEHNGTTTTFRLYFVDCPEKQLRKNNEARLNDQAKYFSLPTPQAASLVGQAAASFSINLLQRPFTVITKWERVFDSQRFYAQILVGGADKSSRDLAEVLVEEGFARIFTKGTQLPGGNSEGEIKQRLHALESASRANRRGAWNH